MEIKITKQQRVSDFSQYLPAPTLRLHDGVTYANSSSELVSGSILKVAVVSIVKFGVLAQSGQRIGPIIQRTGVQILQTPFFLPGLHVRVTFFQINP